MTSLAAAVDDLRRAEAEVRSRKDALASAVPQIDDPDLATAVAIYAYWHMPEVPVAPLAALATGLTGGRAQKAFLKLAGTRASAVACGGCGGPVTVHSRDEMKRILTAKLRYGQLPHCEACRSTHGRPAPVPMLARPVSNRKPSNLEREVLTAHLAHKEAMWIEALCLWGVERLQLRPEHITIYLQDADAGVAAAHGVSRDDYLAWLETEGSVRCSGMTIARERCKHNAKGLTYLPLHTWVAARALGGYCLVHGG
ncbi:MAG: hypothetical protein ACJ798_06010 [Phenylobacterium sp.]